MSLTLPVVVARLRREVSNAESAFDAALLSSAAVQQTIIAARAELDVPVHTGQQALLRLQRAQAQLLAAQNDLFRAHDELARIGETMTGEEEYTPPSGLDSDEPELRVAA
jgi:hypothetical protein